MFKLLFDRKNFNLYPWYFAEECLTFDIEKIFGKKIKKTLLEFKGNHLYSYVDIEQFNQIGEFLFEKVKKDKKFYSLVEKKVLKTGDDLMFFCSQLKNLDLKALSNKQLNGIYSEYAQNLKIMRAWGWVPTLIDGVAVSFLSDYIQEKLRVFLNNIEQEEKLSKYYSILSSSEQKSDIQTEEFERLKLIQKINLSEKSIIKIFRDKDSDKIINILKGDFPDIWQQIRKHAKKFEWLTYAYIGPVMNEKDVINLIKDSLKQKTFIDQQIKNIKIHYKTLKKEKKEIINKIDLSNELRYLFDMSSFFMYLKDLRKGIYQKSYVAMDPIINEIANRINLTPEETKYLNADEIEQALICGKDFKKIAFQRTKYCVALTMKGKTKIYQDKKAKNIIKKETIVENVSKNLSEFKGMVAYVGKVKGAVKIILTAKDIFKIKEGEILVSSATNPDLIMAMKKASAFITDTGGITSHASIVAREMRKPCIIGTKIATQVLKDGDYVEVDADSGVVRILRK